MSSKDSKEVKYVELWKGHEVEIEREYLLKDADYLSDLAKARKEKDYGAIIDMTFALVGENALEETRQHIVEQCGFFNTDVLSKVMERIISSFPKASSSSSKRW